ncbi:MAG TPA: hypothetical protein VNK95_22605 [Caldilineaceae bacterium]|nr:hypothetical protein [Caldilineaceae bacterium]
MGTWFSGDKLPYDFYDPTTGKWADPTGLGQMIIFAANGDYTYTAIARTQYGQCSGNVSVYRQGKARREGASLILTPDYAKTRTVTACGTTEESISDGPYTPQRLGYRVEVDQFGHIQLILTDDSLAATYFKDGMVSELVGAWRHGAVSSHDFYDPATQTFAPATGEGMWFRFYADGAYSAGEVGYAATPDGCALTGWVIQHGTLSVSGGALTVTPTSGVARVENACTPGEAQQEEWVDSARTYTWLLRDRTTTPKLVLIPLERFQEIEFTRE